MPDRAHFNGLLEQALVLHRRDRRPVALIYCDIAEFRRINSAHGHAAGDRILAAVALRVTAAAAAEDIVCRIGGDEFAVLTCGGAPVETANRIRDALLPELPLDDQGVTLRVGIGVAALGADSPPANADQLLGQVDAAVIEAKKASSTAVVSFDESLTHREEEGGLELDLGADLAAGALEVAYQPITTLSGEVWAYEALARWQHDGEIVAPDTFIPLADRAGLLPGIDMLVISRAIASTCLMAMSGQRARLTVNVSVTHLADPGVPAHFEQLLALHGLAAEDLIAEIPQDPAVDTPLVQQNLQTLRAMGVQLALADFGRGYSTLSRMSSLSPDIIKLDRSFIAPLEHGMRGRHTEIVGSVIQLAHRLGITVVAEGVETHAQLRVLEDLDCDLVQGFLLGRPELRVRS